jgi:hypothetical protein
LTDPFSDPLGSIPLSSLRSALIQVLNFNINQEMIISTLEYFRFQITSTLKLNINDFRMVYRR